MNQIPKEIIEYFINSQVPVWFQISVALNSQERIGQLLRPLFDKTYDLVKFCYDEELYWISYMAAGIENHIWSVEEIVNLSDGGLHE